MTNQIEEKETRNMNNIKKARSLAALLLTLCLILGCCPSVNAKESDLTEDQKYLLDVGTPLEEVLSMDKDIMSYIANDLRQSGKTIEYLEVEEQPQIVPYATENLTGITFYVSAYKAGDNEVRFFPTYEFTTAKKPAGNDCFSFVVGDAFRPFQYVGALWYKDDQTMSNWKISHNITANSQGLQGASYSGSQLGTPSYAIKFKGCTGCYATLSGGTDKRISMGYLYNPNNLNYSVNFSIYGIGFGISGSGRAYQAGSIQTISY